MKEKTKQTSAIEKLAKDDRVPLDSVIHHQSASGCSAAEKLFGLVKDCCNVSKKKNVGNVSSI